MSHPILESIVEQPFLSAEQLGVMYAAHPNTVRGELKFLQSQGLVNRINPRSPDLETRAVFYPTARGICEIARTSLGRPIPSFNRLIELWLALERVYRVRNLLLVMERPFHAEGWHVERNIQFTWRERSRTLNLQGVGVAEVDNYCFPFVLHWDTDLLAEERQHIARWVEWNWATRLANANTARPVFVVLASDNASLERHYAELRAAAFARNLPIPVAYLTTKAEAFRNDTAAPTWYLADTGKRTTLFGGAATKSTYLSEIPFIDFPSRKGTFGTQPRDFSQIRFNLAHPRTLTSLAALKRALSPQAKSVLSEIGTHPMLSQDELAELLYAAPRRIGVVLGQLEGYNLIQSVFAENETRCVLTDIGVAYLAAVNGFGRGVRRYAIARGWKRGMSALVRHWQHTRAANEFFMQIVRAVRKSKARFVWQSELESRMYYAARGRRRSYLPDGGGIYEANGRRIQIALEMDRGTVSRERWRARLKQYHAFVDSVRLQTPERGEFCLLVITTSWTRAKNLRQLALETARMRQSPVIPMWITTADAVQVRGLGEPIWRDVRDWQSHRLLGASLSLQFRNTD